MDERNYVAPTGRGTFTVVVNGEQRGEFNTQNEAENAYNATTQGGAQTAAPGAAPGAADPTVGYNPGQLDVARQLADQAAYRAYLQARLELDREQGIMRDEREKERIALERARDAWTQTYQTAGLSGYMPGTGAAGKGQAVLDAIGGLRANPAYQAADGAARQQMEAATIAQATGIDPGAALQAVQQLRALTAQTGQMSSAALVEQVLARTPGGGGAPTLEREAEQNRTTIQALTLLSQLRGPENAFAYANTLANLPESIRSNIQAAMGRLPFTPQNPAQRGLFGDVGVGAAGQGMALGPVYQAQGALPAATGPRTAMAYLPAPQAAAPQQPYTPPAGQAAGNAPVQPTPAAVPGGWPAQQAAYRAQAGPAGPGTGLEQMPTYGPRTQPYGGVGQPGGMTAPNRISPTDWLRADEFAKRLYWAGLENQGEDITSAKWRYEASLPRAVGPRTGAYRAA